MLNQKLAEKVPGKLQDTLNVAFAKAFMLIFEKGTTVIEKTYRKEELEKTFQVNQYADEIKQNRSSLRAFTKKAGTVGAIGGAFDVIYMKQISAYANLKYWRRFLADKK